jgi:HlyD family secretion protein
MPTRLPGPAFWLSIVGVLALVLVGGMVLTGPAAHRTSAPIAAAPTPYSAVAAGKADVEGGIIQVASRITGVVREVDVKEGNVVHRGQVLARQEDDAPRLAVQTATANLAAIRAHLGLTQVQLHAAEREKARVQPMGDVLSRQQIDQAGDLVDTTEATLADERAAVDVAAAQLGEARYHLDETVIRAPVDGVIVRRYANPGVGASTLNVTPMFDLEPAGHRIVRAEVTETALPAVAIGGKVEIVPETDQSRAYPGTVLRRAGVFGARKLQSDDPSERTDERVVEVVVSADGAPLLVGQRVLVKFLKPVAPRSR